MVTLIPSQFPEQTIDCCAVCYVVYCVRGRYAVFRINYSTPAIGQPVRPKFASFSRPKMSSVCHQIPKFTLELTNTSFFKKLQQLFPTA